MTGRSASRVIVVGAGMGGLAASIDLASRGVHVTLLEKASRVGGKMREVVASGRTIDAGPTVLTMRWVFDELFADAGATFGDRVELARSELVARHAFGPDERDRLEGLVRDMLRPMLADWLDKNLPPMVERLVEREIARLTRG